MILNDIEEVAAESGIETVGGLRDALPFRCFHCMVVFSGDDARRHFGLSETSVPECLILAARSPSAIEQRGE